MCPGFAALDHTNTDCGSGHTTSGAGICCCTRHELIEKNGVGDLQKGERSVDKTAFMWMILTVFSLGYANTDYIFAKVIKHYSMALHKVITYDIACQWSIHLKSWLKKIPLGVRIDDIGSHDLVPQLHILRHKAPWPTQCLLNYQPGGHTDGEGIECTHATSGP